MRIAAPRAHRLKPANGFSHYVHFILTIALPLLVLIFVRMQFTQLAIMVVLLSKWRMLAVRPRYWLTNIRSNSVDILVGVSLVVFMAHTVSPSWQAFWAAAYAIWLIVIKPRSGVLMVSLQAFLAQILGLTALFVAWTGAPLVGLVVAVAGIAYVSARHFFTSFEDEYALMYTHVWTYFAAALAWVLGHWLLFYGELSQITLLLSVLSFSLAGMYYLSENDKLSALLRRQFIFIMVAVIVVVVVFSDWGDKYSG